MDAAIDAHEPLEAALRELKSSTLRSDCFLPPNNHTVAGGTLELVEATSKAENGFQGQDETECGTHCEHEHLEHEERSPSSAENLETGAPRCQTVGLTA
tara:strand:- start:327 stop:623 length:297 start_codon:yes stop_codon:yes gene_type:complete